MYSELLIFLAPMVAVRRTKTRFCAARHSVGAVPRLAARHPALTSRGTPHTGWLVGHSLNVRQRHCGVLNKD